MHFCLLNTREISCDTNYSSHKTKKLIFKLIPWYATKLKIFIKKQFLYLDEYDVSESETTRDR